MARWEPDARGRLLRAAVELFTENGYDATTTAQIAERAGLTKTTLFRLFRDKREILFQGQAALMALVADSIAGAPSASPPVELIASALRALADAHADNHPATGQKLQAIIASSEELRERAAFKRAAITSAFEQALTLRLGDARHAGVLADIGVRAYYSGYEAWIADEEGRSFIEHALGELAAHDAAMRDLAVAATR